MHAAPVGHSCLLAEVYEQVIDVLLYVSVHLVPVLDVAGSQLLEHFGGDCSRVLLAQENEVCDLLAGVRVLLEAGLIASQIAYPL